MGAWGLTVFCLISAIGMVWMQFILFMESWDVCDTGSKSFHSAECKDIETMIFVLGPVTLAMLGIGAVMPSSYFIAWRKGLIADSSKVAD